MKINYGSLEQCFYCFKWFSPTVRQESNHRKNWFCCDSHRSLSQMGRVLCQSCSKKSMKINNITCNSCHISLKKKLRAGEKNKL